MKTSLTILLTLCLPCGCAVGPNYQRPVFRRPPPFGGKGRVFPRSRPKLPSEI